MELQDKLYEEILSLCSKGDKLVDDSMYNEAVEIYLKALKLIPEPKRNWEASTWIYTALGDTCFLKEDYEASRNYLFDAINCPDGIENPFVMLRLGESLFELKEVSRAKEYLLKAYMLAGDEIFQSEVGKYFDVIKDEI